MAANEFMTRYRQDNDYRQWVDDNWGRRAFEKPPGIIDTYTRDGILLSYGQGAHPRKCTGSNTAFHRSRNNAEKKGAKCCSQWQNGQMGSRPNDKLKQSENCGYVWSGQPENMDANELVMPVVQHAVQHPIDWEARLRLFAPLKYGYDEYGNYQEVNCSEFIDMSVGRKLGKLQEIYLLLCGPDENPVELQCNACRGTIRAFLMQTRTEPDEEYMRQLNTVLMRMFYELALPQTTRQRRVSAQRFRDEFLRLCIGIRQHVARRGGQVRGRSPIRRSGQSQH